MAALSCTSMAARASAPKATIAGASLKPSAASVGVMFGKLSVTSKKLSVSNGTTVTMAAKSKGTTFNVQVYPGETEPAESALRRFRRAVMTAGVIPEVRRRRYFENSQDIKKRKTADARRKRRGRPQKTRTYAQALEPDTRGNRFGGDRNRDSRGPPPPRSAPPSDEAAPAAEPAAAVAEPVAAAAE